MGSPHNMLGQPHAVHVRLAQDNAPGATITLTPSPLTGPFDDMATPSDAAPPLPSQRVACGVHDLTLCRRI